MTENEKPTPELIRAWYTYQIALLQKELGKAAMAHNPDEDEPIGEYEEQGDPPEPIFDEQPERE